MKKKDHDFVIFASGMETITQVKPKKTFIDVIVYLGGILGIWSGFGCFLPSLARNKYDSAILRLFIAFCQLSALIIKLKSERKTQIGNAGGLDWSAKDGYCNSYYTIDYTIFIIRVLLEHQP